MKSGITAAGAARDTGTLGLHSTHSAQTMKRAAGGAVLAICVALLAGCETLQELLPKKQDAADPGTTLQTHAEELSRIRGWTLHGTLAARPTGGDASRVTLRWSQSPDSYLMRFMGPLGVGLFEVEGSANTVEAKFPDGRRTSATSPEALLEREIGWSVPLQGLRYWIIGLPAPDGTPSQVEFDDRGRLARLEQAGWTVVYEQYGALDGLPLPERIRFSNASVDATVIVRRWKVEGTGA
ncbi:MAG: lipoprotein insertase outer membrane protein LolB [Thiotrichales bacterium]|nr:lipoprotein insertase outer membrane protein LolB [Thiotrichales bacterium]MCY4284412.1 lipoprotein insertase outer membrane protein LolB [Thiotrichales bacterium]